MIEVRDGSDDCLKSRRAGICGQMYVDEVVQVGINDDPTDAGEDDCETFCYALQGANFNVLGLIESDGDLKERYAYTPGVYPPSAWRSQRSVHKSAGSNDVLCSAPLMESQRVEISSVAQSYGLCDVGHRVGACGDSPRRGLLHDKEFGLLHNRARYLHPRLGRFLSRDPLGYVDGMDGYEYLTGQPLNGRDPQGSATEGRLPLGGAFQIVTTKGFNTWWRQKGSRAKLQAYWQGIKKAKGSCLNEFERRAVAGYIARKAAPDEDEALRELIRLMFLRKMQDALTAICPCFTWETKRSKHEANFAAIVPYIPTVAGEGRRKPTKPFCECYLRKRAGCNYIMEHLKDTPGQVIKPNPTGAQQNVIDGGDIWVNPVQAMDNPAKNMASGVLHEALHIHTGKDNEWHPGIWRVENIIYRQIGAALRPDVRNGKG